MSRRLGRTSPPHQLPFELCALVASRLPGSASFRTLMRADTHQAWVPLAELASWPKMQSLQAETGLSSGADFLERLQRVMQTSREVQVKQVLGVEGPDHGDGALCARRVRPLQPPPPSRPRTSCPLTQGSC